MSVVLLALSGGIAAGGVFLIWRELTSVAVGTSAHDAETVLFLWWGLTIFGALVFILLLLELGGGALASVRRWLWWEGVIKRRK